MSKEKAMEVLSKKVSEYDSNAKREALEALDTDPPSKSNIESAKFWKTKRDAMQEAWDICAHNW